MSRSAVCDFEEKNPPFNSEIIVSDAVARNSVSSLVPARRFYLAVCYTEWMDYFSDPFYVCSKDNGIDSEKRYVDEHLVSLDNYEQLLETIRNKQPYQNNTSTSELEDSHASNDPLAVRTDAFPSRNTPKKPERESSPRKRRPSGAGESTILEELMEESAIEDEGSFAKENPRALEIELAKVDVSLTAPQGRNSQIVLRDSH